MELQAQSSAGSVEGRVPHPRTQQLSASGNIGFSGGPSWAGGKRVKRPGLNAQARGGSCGRMGQDAGAPGPQPPCGSHNNGLFVKGVERLVHLRSERPEKATAPGKETHGIRPERGL